LSKATGMADSARNTQHAALEPDFVIAGNVARDITPSGWAPGGTAVYAGLVARGLGRRVGVVTAAPPDVVAAGLPPDVAVARADVAEATSFENVYSAGGRVQYLRATGSPIPPALVPAAWTNAAVVLLGPVYHEVSVALAARFTGMIGVCAQGFLRRTGPESRVTPMPPAEWDALPVLRHVHVLFLSEEDLGGGTGREVPPAWLAAVPVTVLTAGPRGARLHVDGRWSETPAIPATELDPTGAGDSFAAAFLIALNEGAAPPDAARFAAAVAAFAVEGQGPQAPDRASVTARIERHSVRGSEHMAHGTRHATLGPRS